jgi:hypothetical protein
MKIIKYTNGLCKLIPTKPKYACGNTTNSERREVGLQIANFKERKRIKLTKQRRLDWYEHSIDNGVWLG